MALFSDWDHPSPTHPQLSFSCKCSAVSPPQQSMCGVSPSQYMLSFNVVWCPHPNKVCAVSPLPVYAFSQCCAVFQFVPLIKEVCAVSPSYSTTISVRCPPHVILSWILSKVENLSSSSLQDEATDCFFLLSYMAPACLSI